MAPEFIPNAAHPLVRHVAAALRRLQISSGALVVAVSGGADSVALLGTLLTARPPRPDAALIIAHLNHQLRGPDADADEEFVRNLAARLSGGLIYRSARRDVPALARAAGTNVEDTARRVRYDWLAATAAELGARWVATGHTADDQAETVLHRLLRGTGLRGLRGIAARRPLAQSVELVRPLLEVSRAEILEYLRAATLDWREDATNRDLAYTRNRIRHELLPQLAEYNPAIGSLLGRLARQADEAYRDLEARTRILLAAAERPRGAPWLVFDRASLAAAPRHLVRELFHLVWERERWPLGEMNHAHWERLATLACGEGAAVDLPGRIRARCRGRVFQVGRVP